jgi:hypothetical protein
MSIPTRLVLGTAATLVIAGAGAAVATQASAHSPSELSFTSHLTAIQFFTSTGPVTGFPTAPLVPGDRIIGQDTIVQSGQPVGHDNEVCTVSFGRDVLCQDILIFDGRGDLKAGWTVQWPASGPAGPSSFEGIVEGGTDQFRSSHGSFHAIMLPSGDVEITADLNND